MPPQTTTFEELAAFNGNPAGFGFMPALAQTVSFAQSAESWLLVRGWGSSEPTLETAQQAVSEVARYIQTHAEIAENPRAGIDDKIESKRKVDQGKDALRACVSLFTPARVSEIQSEVRRAVDQEQSPAQSVATISIRAVELVPLAVDEEVRAAATFAAAGTILIAKRFALTFGTSTREEIRKAIGDAVNLYPQAQAVLNFLDTKTYDSLKDRAAMV